MRFLSGVIVGVLICGSTVQTSTAQADELQPAPAAVEPVDVDTATVPAVSDAEAAEAEQLDDDAADLVAELPARRTGDFGLVGVTWNRGFDDTGMTVQVRLRTDGAWSPWDELHVENEEGAGGRDGTEPLWVGSADGVAVRVTSPTGERPPGLSVATIDPGTIPAETSNATNAFYDTSSAAAVTQIADGTPSYTSKPTIISRSAWGAKPNTYCDEPRFGNETRGVVVHHTAGSNTYTKAQSASIVRGVQAYHMKGRDWCDIGYNFLVDKFGQIFEGRSGGVDRPVRGAHAGDKWVNTYAMGVSMMGTFTSSEPSVATKDSMVKLLGWRLGTTYHLAKGKYNVGTYDGDDALDRIDGHKDVTATACPGVEGYKWLEREGGLRDRVEAYISNYNSAAKRRAAELGATATGPVFIGEYGITGGRKVRMGKLDLYSISGGVFSVGGVYRTVYTTLDSQAGVLGAPKSDAESTARAVVSLQRFDHGTIYQVTRSNGKFGYALWGAMWLKYVDLGEANGVLGAPTKGQTKLADGRYRAYFYKGYLTREKNGSISVTMK